MKKFTKKHNENCVKYVNVNINISDCFNTSNYFMLVINVSLFIALISMITR